MSSPPYAIAPQMGSMTAASITAASLTAISAATALTVLTTSRQARQVIFSNTCNQGVQTTLNGVDWIYLPASLPFVSDLGSNFVYIAPLAVIGAYAPPGGTAPTSGLLAITVE